MLWLSSAVEKAVGAGMRCPETRQGAALDPTIHCCSPLVWLVGSQWSGRAHWGGTGRSLGCGKQEEECLGRKHQRVQRP